MAPSSKVKRKLPEAPISSNNQNKKTAKHPLFEKTPKSFRIGADIQPRRDLSRFIKWPRYVYLQRQKRILLKRLKVPPALNQFNTTLDANQTSQIMRLLSKYKPETKQEKKARLLDEAQKTSDGKVATSKKPMNVKGGINHVVQLIEKKQAKLVIIAHDVDPIELVVFLPALCRRKDVPYCIIKSKARLGKLLHLKTATAVAVDCVRKEDQGQFDNFCKSVKGQFNDNMELRRRWGGGIMGVKSQHESEKKERVLAAEAAKKLGALH